MSEEFDKMLEESGFRTPSFEDISTNNWKPEDYGFEPGRIDENRTRYDVYYNGKFELRRRPHDYWLLRKRVKNEKGNTEFLQRFYFKIEPDEDKKIVEWLLVNGLK